jgi:hypothetical protein
MSSSETLGKKKLSDIVVGDRVCFKAHQVIGWQQKHHKSYIHLSSDVTSIVDLVDGYRELCTTAGRLRAYPGTYEFELVGSDYDQQALQGTWCKESEKFAGVSIE